MTNPNDLLPEQTNCPLDCPFLSDRHFLPDILPHFLVFVKFLNKVVKYSFLLIF